MTINLASISDILAENAAQPTPDLIGTFRALVESVVVSPHKAGEPYQVNIQGYLVSLMGIDQSALMVVAREGLEPPTPGL